MQNRNYLLGQLLKELGKTNSPKKKWDLIAAYLPNSGLDVNIRNDLDSYYGKLIHEKREIGRNYARGIKPEKSSEFTPTSNGYKQPAFFDDYKGGKTCDGCHNSIEAGDCWKWKRDINDQRYWHDTNQCWPAKYANLFVKKSISKSQETEDLKYMKNKFPQTCTTCGDQIMIGEFLIFGQFIGDKIRLHENCASDEQKQASSWYQKRKGNR